MKRPELLAVAVGSFVAVGLVLAMSQFALGVSEPTRDQAVERERLEVEKRKLYLTCLHEYSLGTVVGEDLGVSTQGARKYAMHQCAFLAGLKPEEVVTN